MAIPKMLLAAAALFFFVTSCSVLPGVSRSELAQIIERDAQGFLVTSIPEDVLTRLATHKVVLVGEIHHLTEHREFVAELVRNLHARGFRQLLMELPHLADWLLEDFVNDGGLMPAWEPPMELGGALIAAIRDFNRTLPEPERFQVRAIDVNLQDYGGGESFRNVMGALASHLTAQGPLEEFLQGDYSTPESQTNRLETLKAGLEADRPGLLSAWGARSYDTVSEMVDVELASVPIRAMREGDYDQSARLREEAIKGLAELRLAESSTYRTMINIGVRHAQKKRLMGTKQEWLGDYLVHQSEAAGGSVLVLSVTAARILPAAGGTVPEFDLRRSPENELFRVMSDTRPDQIVFLPVDDPLFVTGGVRMNYEGEIFTAPPKDHFDVFVLFPLAHYDR
jgi:hypothetical protein